MTAHFDATRLAEKASNLHREQKGPTKGAPPHFATVEKTRLRSSA